MRVDDPDGIGATPFFMAALAGHSDVVKLLMKTPGVDVNRATKTSSGGVSSLFMAAKQGSTATVELLLSIKGLHVNQQAADGATALYIAAFEGRAEVGAAPVLTFSNDYVWLTLYMYGWHTLGITHRVAHTP